MYYLHGDTYLAQPERSSGMTLLEVYATLATLRVCVLCEWTDGNVKVVLLLFSFGTYLMFCPAGRQ